MHDVKRIRSVGQLCSVPSREPGQLGQIRKIHRVKCISDASHRMRRAGSSEDDDESKNRDDQTRADYKDALQHLTSSSSAATSESAAGNLWKYFNHEKGGNKPARRRLQRLVR
jgi:hypothetical protein